MLRLLKSIRVRLMLWQLLASALLITAFSLVLYSTIEGSLYHEIDASLAAKAKAILSGLDFQAGQLNFTPDEADFSTADLLVQISDLDGKILGRSANLGKSFLPLDAARRKAALEKGPIGLLETVAVGQGPPLRLFSILALGDGGEPAALLQVGTSLAGVENSLTGLRFWLLIIAPSLLALSGLGSFFLAGRLLRPLKTMAQTAERIEEHNLSQRLPVANSQDEIGQLAGTFNRVFERLQRAFENQRRFVSDASHELRTPLTILRGKLEVALRKLRSPHEYRQVLEAALVQSERLSRLVGELLLLARADSGDWRHELQPVRLDTLALELWEELNPLAQSRQISFEAVCPEPLITRGNLELLRHMILNLLDNAIKYTPDGGRVELSLAGEGDQARLSIADTGSGIPAEDLPHIFERFYRVDKARSQRVAGIGLGLSIVWEIVSAHQGKIEVESQSGAGTTFTVRLPLESAALFPDDPGTRT